MKNPTLDEAKDFLTSKGIPIPKVGQDIYVGTSLYIGHGVDDFTGGLCKVKKIEAGISAGEPTIYVTVKERPETDYNWIILFEEQDKLKKRFGENRGYKDPDYSPEFNRD